MLFSGLILLKVELLKLVLTDILSCEPVNRRVYVCTYVLQLVSPSLLACCLSVCHLQSWLVFEGPFRAIYMMDVWTITTSCSPATQPLDSVDAPRTEQPTSFSLTLFPRKHFRVSVRSWTEKEKKGKRNKYKHEHKKSRVFPFFSEYSACRN